MDCKYVRQCNCICFTFNSQSASCFYLAQQKNRLRIIQENLYTNLIINEFPVPIKQQELDSDNFCLQYNVQFRFIILTLSDHILIYSIDKRSLVFAGEARGKNPYFINKIATYGKFLYFSATQQRNVYSIDLLEVVKNGSVTNYIKFKIIDIQIAPKKVVAVCDDNNLRVWESDTQAKNPLRGIALEKIGKPTCLQFSKDFSYLLVGTQSGCVQGFDGDMLGISNTIVLNQKLSNQSIRSLCWFHYSGEAQSRRFLTFTNDGSVKLYSFWFQRQKQQKDRFMGKANQLSLLYINRNKLKRQYKVAAHAFSNFLQFTPGIMLFMVDHYPKIYYPVITSQKTHTFESLVPGKRKQIQWQRDFFFIQGLQIKRLREQIQTKVSLQSVLQYEGLKILKLDYRPYEVIPNSKHKFLLTYYSGSMVRSLILSNIDLQKCNQAEHFKQYAGASILFLGPKHYTQPLILILQQDRQTITILSQKQFNKEQLHNVQPDQKVVLQLGPGQIYHKSIHIKIQRIFVTPFRNFYVLIYQSENLLRFSNNINYNAQVLDYDVCTEVFLRLDYTDIIIDMIWTARGEVGAVVCLDKVVFVNSELKIVRSVFINGYIIQAQWIAYTLIITTKVDVQYVDVYGGSSMQLYCLEDYESKYLIMGILADRIIGIEKKSDKIVNKIRYFNLMEPLLAGYLSYHKLASIPIDQQVCKNIIEAYSPYHLVSQHFLNLLNDHKLNKFAQYFIDGNSKLYSRSIRAKTLNNVVQMQRFIEESKWLMNKKKILDYFLSFWELHDSSDAYEVSKSEKYLKNIQGMLGEMTMKSILDAAKNPQAQNYLEIVPNFGQKSLIQYFKDIKEGQLVNMQIQPFKAQNIGEWVGQFGAYIEAKIGANDAGQVQVQQNETGSQGQNEEGQFNKLLVYYRFDEIDLKIHDTVEDLSDFKNDGDIVNVSKDDWASIQDQPMQPQDKWGKKPPQQYSLRLTQKSQIFRQKKINTKHINDFTICIWVNSKLATFSLISLGDNIELGIQQKAMYVKYDGNIKKMKHANEDIIFRQNNWCNLCWVYDKQKNALKGLINSQLAYECTVQMKPNPHGLTIGSVNFVGDVTEFQLWKQKISAESIKQNMRLPLELVYEKRKKVTIKVKNKKKEDSHKEKDEIINSFKFQL